MAKNNSSVTKIHRSGAASGFPAFRRLVLPGLLLMMLAWTAVAQEALPPPVITPEGGSYAGCSLMVTIDRPAGHGGATVEYRVEKKSGCIWEEYDLDWSGSGPWTLTMDQSGEYRVFATLSEGGNTSSEIYKEFRLGQMSMTVPEGALPGGVAGSQWSGTTFSSTGGCNAITWQVLPFIEGEETNSFTPTAASTPYQGGRIQLEFAFPAGGTSFSLCEIFRDGFLKLSGPGGCYADICVLGDVISVENVEAGEGIFTGSTANSFTIRWRGVYSDGGSQKTRRGIRLPKGKVLTGGPVQFSATLYADGRIRLSYGDGNAAGGAIEVGINQGTSGGASNTVSVHSGNCSMSMAPDILFRPSSLPPGLVLSGQSGELSGTPVQPGDFEFRLQAEDESGATVCGTYSIHVDAGAGQVAAPVFSPVPGEYWQGTQVSLSTVTSGAVLYYTTDGTDPRDITDPANPSPSAIPYPGSISVSATTTIKARARVGDDWSDLSTATYIITPPLEITTETLTCVAGQTCELTLEANRTSPDLQWSAPGALRVAGDFVPSANGFTSWTAEETTGRVQPLPFQFPLAGSVYANCVLTRDGRIGFLPAQGPQGKVKTEPSAARLAGAVQNSLEGGWVNEITMFYSADGQTVVRSSQYAWSETPASSNPETPASATVTWKLTLGDPEPQSSPGRQGRTLETELNCSCTFYDNGRIVLRYDYAEGNPFAGQFGYRFAGQPSSDPVYQDIAGFGEDGDVSWELAPLPPGLTLAGNGTTVASPGTYWISVSVYDARTGETANKVIELTVDLPPLDPPAVRPSAPLVSLGSGIYAGQTMEISLSLPVGEEGAEIRYETDSGSGWTAAEPSCSSPVYGNPVSLTLSGSEPYTNLTLRAVICRNGITGPEIVRYYRLARPAQVPAPVFDPEGGTHYGSVAVLCVVPNWPGAIIRYTTDVNSDPDENSALVTGNTITLVPPFDQTLKVRAWDPLGIAAVSMVSMAHFTVYPALQITTTALPDAAQHTEYSFPLQAEGGTGARSWSLQCQEVSGANPGSTFSAPRVNEVKRNWHSGDSQAKGVWKLDLPFSFPFFSRSYSSCWVDVNGCLLFRENETEQTLPPVSDDTPTETDFLSRRMIAVLWSKLWSPRQMVVNGQLVDSPYDIWTNLERDSSQNIVGITIRWYAQYWTNGNDEVHCTVTLFNDGRILLSYGEGANVLGGWSGISAGDRNHCLGGNHPESLAGHADILYQPPALPSGLMLTGEGVLQGTPAMNGSFTFTAYVMDTVGAADARPFTLTVAPKVSTPAVSREGGYVVEGTAVGLTCATSGAEIYYTLDGTEPDENSHLYSGEFILSLPVVPGQTTVLKVKGFLAGYLSSTTAVTAFVVCPRPHIKTSNLDGAEQGKQYSFTLEAEPGSGTPPYLWTVDNLPNGLSCENGQITGNPFTPGSYNVTLRLKDSLSAQTGYEEILPLILEVAVAPPVLNTIETQVNDPQLEISGTKLPGLNLFISLNGTSVYEDMPYFWQNNWQYALTLQEGDNTIELFCRTTSGLESAHVTATVNLSPASATPGGLQARALPGGKIRLEWNSVPAAGTTYTIYEEPGGIVASALATTFHTHSTNLPDRSHTYRITATTPGCRESEKSAPATATSDREAPSASLAFAAAAGTPVSNNTFGAGTVGITLTPSEPLAAAPLLTITPPGGNAEAVSLTEADGTWTGSYHVIPGTPQGAAGFALEAFDPAGNRGTVINYPPVQFDGAEPRAVSLILTPAGTGVQLSPGTPLRVDAAQGLTVGVDLTASETLAEAPALLYALSVSGSQAITAPVMEYIAGHWHCEITIPKEAGAEPEWLTFFCSMKDGVGNAGTRFTCPSSFEVLQQQELPALQAPRITGRARPAGELEIFWNQVFGATSYRVNLSPGGAMEPSEVTAFSWKGTPSEDGEYRVTVQAVRTGSTGDPSNELSLKSDRVPPGAPRELERDPQAEGMRFTWLAPGQTENERLVYRLYRHPGPEPVLTGLRPVAGPVTGLAAADPTPLPGVHWYTVTAADPAGNETPAAWIRVELILPPVAGLQAEAIPGTGVVLTWSHPSRGVAFNVYAGEAGTGTLLNPELLTAGSFLDTTANAGAGSRYTVVPVPVADPATPGPGTTLTLPDAVITLTNAPALVRNGFTLLPVRVDFDPAAFTPDQSVWLEATVDGQTTRSEAVSGLSSAVSPLALSVLAGYGGNRSAEDIRLAFCCREGNGPVGRLILPARLNVNGTGPFVLSLEVDNVTLHPGARAVIPFTFSNQSTVPVELTSAEQGGTQASADVRLQLLDADTDAVLKETRWHQIAGEGVTFRADGSMAATVAPGAEFTSAGLRLEVPAGVTGDLKLRLTVDRIYYHGGQTGQAWTGPLTVEQTVQLDELPYTGVVTEVAAKAGAGAETVVEDGSAVTMAEGLAIIIRGRALNAEDQGLPDTKLNLHIRQGEYVTVVPVQTGATPPYEFSYNFEPGMNGGGIYALWATHPLATEQAVQRSFAICGLQASPRYIYARTMPNYPNRFGVQLTTAGPVNAVNLHVVPVSPGTGWEVLDPGQIDLNSTGNPENPVSKTLYFTLSGNNQAATSGDIPLSVQDGAGVEWGRITIAYEFGQMNNLLRIQPEPLWLGLQQTDGVYSDAAVTFTVENTGYNSLEDLQLRLTGLPAGDEVSPPPAWLRLAGADAQGILRLGRLSTGESRQITLSAGEIPAGLPPTSPGQALEFRLVADGANLAPQNKPVFVTAGATGSGSVCFTLASTAGTNVNQARVELVREDWPLPEETADIAPVFSDAAGRACLADVPAGYYKYRITAPKHDSVTGWIHVQPGAEHEVAVEMDYQLVSLEWSVRPVAGSDYYEIVLSTIFETTIPAPRLVVEPKVVHLDPDMLPGEYLYGVVTVKNDSLIRATNIKFHPPAPDPRYRVDYLDVPPDSLEANSFFRFRYLVTKLSGTLPGASECAYYAGVGVFTFDFLDENRKAHHSGSPLCWAEPVKAGCLDPGEGGIGGFGWLQINGSGGDLPYIEDYHQDWELEGTTNARVRLEIPQSLSLERQNFEARLRIVNALESGQRLENIKISLLFTDRKGQPVEIANWQSGDPDLENSTARFFVKGAMPLSLEGGNQWALTTAVVPGAEQELSWLIIPAPGAGGESPAGVLYYAGAKLTYDVVNTASGTRQSGERTIMPDSITVLPAPQLELEYFLPTSVWGDNPRTLAVEPVVPFPLGLLVHNTGAGAARKLAIESGQPQIVDNEQGLLINFTMTGAEVNGQPAARTFTADFGDLAPRSTAEASWTLTSTLSGRFVSFDAALSHDPELGGDLTSLIKDIRMYSLLKDVRVDLPGRDQARDFLACPRLGDGSPDLEALAVYESNGQIFPVADQSAGAALVRVSGKENQFMLELDSRGWTGGFFTAAVLDPFHGRRSLDTVTREDGCLLDPANAWLTAAGSPDSPFRMLCLFDFDNPGYRYLVTFKPAGSEDHPPVLHYIGPRAFRVTGTATGFDLTATDPESTTTRLTVSGLPPGASFHEVSCLDYTTPVPEPVDQQSNSGTVCGHFTWNPAVGQQGDYWVTFTATDTPADVNNAGLSTSETVHIVVGDGSQPANAPELIYPAKDICLAEPRITVRGIARESEVVFLTCQHQSGNREIGPLPVDRVTGSFSTTLELPDGTTILMARSRNPYGMSADSAQVKVTVDRKPALPPLLRAITQPEGKIKLQWIIPKQSNVQGVRIYRRFGEDFDVLGGEEVLVAEKPAGEYELIDGPENEGCYYYRALTVKLNGVVSNLSAAIDRVCPDDRPAQVLNLQITPAGNIHPATGALGPGATVDISFKVSETLAAPPALFLARNGSPVRLIGVDGAGTEVSPYRGRLYVSRDIPGGDYRLLLGMRDRNGNRTDVELASLTIDTRGPVVVSLEVNPPAPLENTGAVTITVTALLDEDPSPENPPELFYALSSSQPSPLPVAAAPAGAGNRLWTGSFLLPAEAGHTAELLQISYRGEDLLGNSSSTIDGPSAFEVYQGALPALTPPANLKAVSRPAGGIELSWDRVPGAAGYRVYRDATKVAELAFPGLVDTPGLDGTYSYTVTSLRGSAPDYSESEPTPQVTGVSDRVAPAPPENLRLTLKGYGVQADWEPPAGLVGGETVTYLLYRSAAVITSLEGLEPLGRPVAVLFAIDSNPSHQTPYYAVAAMDAAGNVSPPGDSAFLNADLLPVANLVVELDGTKDPVLTWEHSSASINGFQVYAGEPGAEIRLNGPPVEELSFTDTTWRGTGGIRRYLVKALDEHNQESLGREVWLYPLSAVPEYSRPEIYKGEFNPVEVDLANLADEPVENVRAGLILDGKYHRSEPVDLEAGESGRPVKVVVGGYLALTPGTTATPFAEVNFAGASRCIVKMAAVDCQVEEPRVDPSPLQVELFRPDDPSALPGIIPAGDSPLVIKFTQQDLWESMEILTATKGGRVASSEFRLKLIKKDVGTGTETEIARQEIWQTTGNICNLPGGSAVARLGPLEPAGPDPACNAVQEWLSEVISLRAPLECGQAPFTLRVEVDWLHYRLGEPEHVAIEGFTRDFDNIQLAEPEYTGRIDRVTPESSYGQETVEIKGHAVAAPGKVLPGNPKLVLLLDAGPESRFRRRIDVTAGSDGFFSYFFQPLAKEGGEYRVAAVHPSVREAAETAFTPFTIQRMMIKPSRIQARLPLNMEQPLELPLILLPGTAATNIRLEPVVTERFPDGGLPAGMSILLGDPPLAPLDYHLELDATGENGQTVTSVLPLTIAGTTAVAVGDRNGTLVLRLVSDETKNAGTFWQTFIVDYELVEVKPVLVPAVPGLTIATIPGQSAAETLIIRNAGFAPLENAEVTLLAPGGTSGDGTAPPWVVIGNLRPLPGGPPVSGGTAARGTAVSGTAARGTGVPPVLSSRSGTAAGGTAVPAVSPAASPLAGGPLHIGGTPMPPPPRGTAVSGTAVPAVLSSRSGTAVPAVFPAASPRAGDPLLTAGTPVPPPPRGAAMSGDSPPPAGLLSIPPGGQAELLVTAAPGADVPSSSTPLELVLQIAGGGLSDPELVPVEIYLDASGKGRLDIKPVDYYSESGVSRPAGLPGPTLTLTRLDGPAGTAPLTAAGDAGWHNIIVDQLPAGLYEYYLTAPRHETVRGRVTIQAGVTASLQVALPNAMVSFEWEVLPAAIEDKYQVVLTADYETSVPAPVLKVSPLTIPLPASGAVTGELRLEHLQTSSLTVYDIQVKLPDGGDQYTFELLCDPPDSLLPGDTVYLPYRLTRLAPAQKTGASGATGGATVRLEAGEGTYQCCNCGWGAITGQFGGICKGSATAYYFFPDCARCKGNSDYVGNPVDPEGYYNRFGQGFGPGGWGPATQKECPKKPDPGPRPGSCEIKIAGDRQRALAFDKDKAGENSSRSITFNLEKCKPSGKVTWVCGSKTGEGRTFTVDFSTFFKGKHAVTATLTTDQGSCSDTVEVFLLDVTLLVDTTNDRKIDDKDKDLKKKKKDPFIFWTVYEYDRHNIQNLTNYAMMAMQGDWADDLKLALRFRLEWEPIWGEPSIRIIPVPTEDLEYMKVKRYYDYIWENAEVVRPSGLDIPHEWYVEGHFDRTLKRFIFCGLSAGEGLLSLKIVDKNDRTICKDTVRIKLMGIENFYSRVSFRQHPPNDMEVADSFRFETNHLKGKDENPEVTVYLNGYNMTYQEFWDWTAITQKRLYWAGSDAQLVTVTWPGDPGPTGSSWTMEKIRAFHYDEALLRAHPSGKLFAQLLLHLAYIGGYRVRILAHSTGSLIAGLALKQTDVPVDCLTFMEGSAPRNAFDRILPRSPNLYNGPLVGAREGQPGPGDQWIFDYSNPIYWDSTYTIEEGNKPYPRLRAIPANYDPWAGYLEGFWNLHPGIRVKNTYSEVDDVVDEIWEKYQKLFLGENGDKDIIGKYWPINPQYALMSCYYRARSYPVGASHVGCPKSTWEDINAQDLGIAIHSSHWKSQYWEVYKYWEMLVEKGCVSPLRK